jgi:hypothetical protein
MGQTMSNEIPWENFSFEDPDDIIAYGDERVQAERLRVLGLLENAERMQNLYRTVWWGHSDHPRSPRAARRMTDLLRAELMGEDDE